MRAVVYSRYGGPEVLQLTERPRPEVKGDELLIRVRATTVSSGDQRARSLDMPRGFGPLARPVFGFLGPRQPVLGTEFAGDVEAVGAQVSSFRIGDAVFGFRGFKQGCYAEYTTMKQDGALAPKPANLSYEQAASLCFGGTTALDFYRRGKLQAGERVLVNGASGAVGTALVQLGKHFGAHVTGVCSGTNVALVKSLGADEVIDYTRQDFAQSGARWNVIVDTVGTAPYARSRAALEPGGRLLLVLGDLPETLRAPWRSAFGPVKVIAGPASERAEDVRTLGQLAASGELLPVIDRSYPIEQIVDAHRYVDTGRKRGSVVIALA